MAITDREVRVRFAPSPTGPLHIGGVRTALYNYLFARQNGGKMILRIEDTDSHRFVPGVEDYINEALAWLGIGIDEGVREGGPYGPYKQSERRDIYREHVKLLLVAGKAYIAFDTPEELEAKRNETANFQYDASTRMQMRNSLTLPADEVQRLIDNGEQYVVRFRIEPYRDVAVDDLIRGRVTIKSDILDDKVLYKSADDLPTYHPGKYRRRPSHENIARNPRRRMAALGSPPRTSLRGIRLGRHSSRIRASASAPQARRKRETQQARRRPPRLPCFPPRMA